MQKFITFVLTFLLIVPFFIPFASAYSDETEQCIDRVSGTIYGYISDYDISSEMTSEIASFCQKTNAVTPYSDLDSLAMLSRDYVEDFYAVSLVSRYEVYSLGQPLFDGSDFSISWKTQIQDNLDNYKSNIVSRRFALNDQYTDELIDEYPYLQTDLDNIQDAELDFLDAYDAVSAGLTYNYVCTDGYGSDSSCSCFDGYEWNAAGNACVEASAVVVETVDNTQNTDTQTTESESIFDDMTPSDDNYEAISYLKDNGIIDGYSDGTFKPDNALNRAELLKILVEGKGISPDSSQYANCFPDVTTDWYAKYVCYAKEQGWIEGYPDGTFRPATSVNKVEAIKMLLEVFGEDSPDPSSSPFSDVPVSEWYAKYVVKAEELGLLEETGYYSPASYITRGGVSENIYRLLIQL